MYLRQPEDLKCTEELCKEFLVNMPQKNSLLKLSILVPVFNEIKCIETFTNRLFKCFQKEQPQYIFIDDGSDDGSKEWLTKNLISRKLSGTVKLIDLPKNKGKG